MARIECPREDDVLMMVSTGRWPMDAPAELRAHADQCQICGELGLAAAAIGAEAELPVPALPSAGTMWWRAQLRARQDAARHVVRPITAAQLIAFAALVGVAGAVFGATTQWFQRGLQTAGRVIREGAGTVSTSLPSLPQDLSSISMTSWIIVTVVGIGLVAGAVVVSWAMKEE